MKVAVTGIGLLCCLGDLTQSWQGLLAGKSGLKIHQPFPELPPRPMGLIGEYPINITELTQIVVKSALKDAHLAPPLVDCGVVIGSSRACQGKWEQFLTQGITENWLETLPHQGAITTARLIRTTGAVLAPMAACATAIWAIAQGVELIQQGRCERVIAGAVEAPITPLTLTGFEQMGALAKTGCYPFDKKREGLVLAEGAAVFILESARLAQSREAFIYGKISGFGLTCDANHITAPANDNQSAIIAVKKCFSHKHKIDYIHAHGTSTQINDQREAQLIQELFGQSVAVSSTKGATGHTLGASGALGMAFSLMALKHQILPPCVGLEASPFDLNLVTQARQQRLKNILCFSFGFGGQNGVVALSI